MTTFTAEIGRALSEFEERDGRAAQPHLLLLDRAAILPGHRQSSSARGRPRSKEGVETRIVIEKPFGYDLDSARELNAACSSVFDESQVFRIDHYLGKETVQNLMALRFANALFEPVWNRNYIDNVQITAAEDIGIERRAGYYEGAGALRDLVQNHMLQLLALLAMEPPASFEANRLRDEKVKVLEAIVAADAARGKQDGAARAVRPRSGRRANRSRATARRRGWLPTRGPRPTPRCGLESPTGAGRGCRSICAPASAWRAR